MIVVDSFGLTDQLLFGQFETFRFTAAGFIHRAFGFTLHSFLVVLLDHGRENIGQGRLARPSLSH